MKKIPAIVLIAFVVASLLAFRDRFPVNKTKPANPTRQVARIVRCGTDWASLKKWISEVDIPPVPGAGIYTWKITTKSDSAQFYFNQGINMYYSFHILESMASFKKAARFDPGSAMIQWAQALAYGPNINDFGYVIPAEARIAARSAVNLQSGCSEKEKLLIAAQRTRFVDDTTLTHEAVNGVYAAAMKAVYEKFPADADVAALYADALMLQHPWDLWMTNGQPRPWTPLVRRVLENLLAKNPDHPGGNHYYIHVMEPSPYAAKALPSATRLGKTNPGLSHVVHMPSHIYLRTGLYNLGVAVNEDAVNSYRKSIPLFAPVTGADFLYLIHNLHMQTNNAMLAGRYEYSRQSAEATLQSIPAEYYSTPGPVGNVVQYISMTPLFVNIRFGKWDEVLSYPEPSKGQVYAHVLYHFGRGIAFSRKNNREAASLELDQMREYMKDSSLIAPLTPFSAAIDGAKVAEQILLGVIHEDKDLKDGAIRHYQQADSIETRMVYNEPRDWLLSPKHYLGRALLNAGKWKEAEKIFLQDLAYNNENGWSLVGLYHSLSAQKKQNEAGQVMSRYKRAFSKADIQVNVSAY